jgi:hypothetical protein
MNFSKKQVILCSGATYILSLFLPALLFKSHEPVTGGNVIALGWWGALMHEFAWFANPVYLYAILAYKTSATTFSKFASTTALVLGLTSFHAKEWWFNEGSGTPITSLGLGYYVWMLSFCVLLAGSFITTATNHADDNPWHENK